MQCPRCENNAKNLVQECENCGWQFTFYLGEISPKDLNKEQWQLGIARSVWNAHQKGTPDFSDYIDGIQNDQKSSNEALVWLHRDAERGIAEAQNLLGEAYCYGYGIDADEEKALVWFRKAVALNNPRAYYNLGEMYRNGYGVDENEAEALKWYEKGSNLGNKECVAAIEDIRKEWEKLEQERLKKISESDDIEKFVNEHNGSWTYQQYQSLRDSIYSRYGAVNDEKLDALLDDENRRYVARKEDDARIQKERNERDRVARAKSEKERIEKEIKEQMERENQEKIEKEWNTKENDEIEHASQEEKIKTLRRLSSIKESKEISDFIFKTRGKWNLNDVQALQQNLFDRYGFVEKFDLATFLDFKNKEYLHDFNIIIFIKSMFGPFTLFLIAVSWFTGFAWRDSDLYTKLCMIFLVPFLLFMSQATNDIKNKGQIYEINKVNIMYRYGCFIFPIMALFFSLFCGYICIPK